MKKSKLNLKHWQKFKNAGACGRTLQPQNRAPMACDAEQILCSADDTSFYVMFQDLRYVVQEPVVTLEAAWMWGDEVFTSKLTPAPDVPPTIPEIFNNLFFAQISDKRHMSRRNAYKPLKWICLLSKPQKMHFLNRPSLVTKRGAMGWTMLFFILWKWS